MSNPNANVRMFLGPINAAAYWIGDHLLRAGDIVNDSNVSGTTVKAALNYLSTSSTAVFPFTASGLAEQDLVSYDAAASTWRNRTAAAAFKGTGADSLAVGSGSSARGTNDVSIGKNAGSALNTGTGSNIAIGESTLSAITTANNCVAIGKLAGAALTSGVRNVVLGANALTTVTIGQKNTAIGFSCMYLAEAAVSNCVAVGNDALTHVLASAGIITAIGNAALFDLTSGVQNTALGYNAGRNGTTGSRCTCVGYSVLTAGAANDNTFIGNSVGSASVGSQNTAVGSLAFNSASAAVTDIVAMGYNALSATISNTSASGSVGVGSGALSGLTQGIGNTAVGYQAGDFLTTGTHMTILGYDADGSSAGRSGCVVLGSGATATIDNTLVIRMGNTSTRELVVIPVLNAKGASSGAVAADTDYLTITIGGVTRYIELKTTP